MTFDFHLSKTFQGLEGSIAALAFSNDYRYLGSASKNGSGEGIVRIYDVEAQFRTFWSHRRPSQFGIINWDSDCRLIMGTVKGELLMISPKAQKLHAEPDVIHTFSSPIESIEFNKYGNKMLICAGRDINVMEKTNVVVSSAHFLKDQRHSVIAFLHHGLWKINLESGHSQWIIYLENQIGGTAITPDCAVLITAGSRKGLDWYSVSTDPWTKISTSLGREELPITSNTYLPIRFINRGRTAVMGTANGRAVIFNAEHGERIQTLLHSSDVMISGLACHEDALLIVTGNVDGKICVWVRGPLKSSYRGNGILVCPCNAHFAGISLHASSIQPSA
ncbi:WD40-repeat-containing domain protein [Lentinula lateritia]|uniref:WD40-repeat-containing domain protein n=1 Tax=Lentinula lateritia TaxID=40482 RepID=A0ABQ8VGA7_9AGAR|nr:WD40-repeat-containing domain protein [Lentinula lateritia]